MSNQELKIQVIVNDELRNDIKDLVKSQVIAISREEFQQIIREALTDRVKKVCKKLDFKEEIKQVIKECIYKSIPMDYRDFNGQVKHEIRETVREVVYKQFKEANW